ncbi:hypothetical protein G6F65_022753 [Rhizopus arrhizus]|nr:hypothetical protein G6F65_022753 [Rhizopus arrhizus]
MGEGGQFKALFGLQAQRARRGVGVARHVEFGQAPQAAPDAGFGPLLQQESPLVLQHQHTGLAFRYCAAHFGGGQFGLAALAAGDAAVGHRAFVASGLAARAQRGAQIHQPLRVGGHVQAGGGLDLGVGQRP